jgi:hypothetical protein
VVPTEIHRQIFAGRVDAVDMVEIVDGVEALNRVWFLHSVHEVHFVHEGFHGLARNENPSGFGKKTTSMV